MGSAAGREGCRRRAGAEEDKEQELGKRGLRALLPLPRPWPQPLVPAVRGEAAPGQRVAAQQNLRRASWAGCWEELGGTCRTCTPWTLPISSSLHGADLLLRLPLGCLHDGLGGGPTSAASRSPGGTGPTSSASLSGLVDCFQPLLHQICSFLLERPQDFTGFICLSTSVAAEFKGSMNQTWSDLYKLRWEAFHECLSFQNLEEDWRKAYRDTLDGQLRLLLEVFDRQKMPGFTMAAMSAWVRYSSGSAEKGEGFVAEYLSACEVSPEVIPCEEAHRLRFCPPSVRGRLWHNAGCCSEDEPPPVAYPYRVLEGLEGLTIGRGVELQWKMQLGSPFGWWFGKLESLETGEDGLATAEISFGQFPEHVHWHRLQVRFGDSDMRFCSFGGYSGGIRAVSNAEERRWMQFFPKQPVFV